MRGAEGDGRLIGTGWGRAASCCHLWDKPGLRAGGGLGAFAALRFLGLEEAFFDEFADEATADLDAGDERPGYGARDSPLCQGVKDFIESDEYGVLVMEGWKNKGFAFARFLFRRAGRALRVVVAAEFGAVHRGCVAGFAVFERLGAVG